MPIKAIMAIEFEFRGEWYRVDTPQEVVALKRYLRAHALGEESSSSDSPSDSYAGLPAHGKWTSDLFALLMEKIGYFEKKFLAALLSVSHPIDANTAASLSFPGNYRHEKKRLRRKLERDGLLVMGGIQSGLVRHVRALGLEPFDLYQVHISWRGGRRTRYFTVDPGFRFTAGEQGWPPPFLREALNK
ncbi:MAG TPA: hypothetical protein VGS20_12455 [Candidatus Acidoferrales bacterium]|nr:hypothetical protein [Candidatus Acidoferrales bacterium]